MTTDMTKYAYRHHLIFTDITKTRWYIERDQHYIGSAPTAKDAEAMVNDLLDEKPIEPLGASQP